MDPLTYRDAGVDIQAGDEAVRRIARLADATRRPEVIGGIGGFAAFCGIPPGYTEPVLVSSTDGVGTKLKVAFLAGRHGPRVPRGGGGRHGGAGDGRAPRGG